MPYFTKKELVMSLFCPVFTFLWGLLHAVFYFPWDRISDARFWEYFNLSLGMAAMLLGGVLPAVLTWRFKIRTDGFLIKRLIFIAAVVAIHKFLEYFGFYGGTITYFWLYLIVNVTALLLQYLTTKDVTKGERAVLVLSDPVLWWAIYYFVYYMDIILFF